MNILKTLLILTLPISLIACDNTSEPHPSGVTTSHSVGGETNTMEECKYGLDQTAKKYNVTYTVSMDKKDYFSAHLVKDGVQTDLLIACKKKGDYYEALFAVPD